MDKPLETYLRDPEPLVEFKVKVSLSDLKVARTVWGDEGYNTLVNDVLLQLRQKIREAVEGHEMNLDDFEDDEV